MVRGAILAEWSNGGAGSGLLWKIETGGGERERRLVTEEGRTNKGGGFFYADEDRDWQMGDIP